MDFGQIDTAEDSNQGATHHVIDPYTDEPAYVNIGGADVPVTITVLGPDSDKMRQYQSNVMRSMMKRRRGQLNTDELQKRLTGQLVEAVVSWQGVMINGEEVECNRENCKELFEKHAWLREQLLEFQQERTNFLKR